MFGVTLLVVLRLFTNLISSKLLTLGIVYASITLLSLNRNSLTDEIFVFYAKNIIYNNLPILFSRILILFLLATY